MKNKQKRMVLSVCLIGLGVLVLFSIRAGGGNLEPSSAPSSTMHTLDEIHNAINSLSLGGSGQLTGPAAGAKVRDKAYVDLRGAGINGESTDEDYEDWIEVLGVYYSAKQPAGGDLSQQGAHTGGRVDFSDITIIKEIDLASPLLYLKCATGQHLQQVRIEFTVMLTGGRFAYHKIILRDAIVSAFAPVMSYRTNDEYIHLEEISFRYGQINWEYTPYDDQGASGSTVQAGWSTLMNKPM